MKSKFYKILVVILGLLSGSGVANAVTSCAPIPGSYFITCNGVDCQWEDLMCAIKLATGFLIKVGFALMVIAFVVAGYYYMTSAGDANKIKTANSIFRKTTIGILIVLGAYLLVNLLLETLGYKAELPVQLRP